MNLSSEYQGFCNLEYHIINYCLIVLFKSILYVNQLISILKSVLQIHPK